MSQVVQFENGAIRCVADVLEQVDSESVFLVAGRTSYRSCGAEAALQSILQQRRITRYSEFGPNPSLQDVERGLELYCRQHAGLILAVGGGTVLDMAKLIAVFSAQKAVCSDIIEGRAAIENAAPPIIALPMTAGSGSESTHFAVIYVDGTKYSVAHESMLPAYALVDPELTYTLPPNVTAVTGLDALCHGIESLWSVHSTAESMAYSREAIRLAIHSLESVVQHPTAELRYAMCRAAHLAGKAINITKTTAPHALSYIMTSRFGVPHGHAVALTLGETLVQNSLVTDETVADLRGIDHVRAVIHEINSLLGCSIAEDSRNTITSLIRSLGLATRLGEVGITTLANRRLIVETVDVQRLHNNLRKLTPQALHELIARVA